MELFDLLTKQSYHIVGNHSAVKRCKWYKVSMLDQGECYKSRFYGINSHQCMQSTPCLQYCTQSCVFCWRVMADELGLDFNQFPDDDFEWNSPEEVLDGLLREQKLFAQGYKGNIKANQIKVKEAMEPKLFTLSLAGEPTIYPYLDELLGLAKKRNLLTFVVTNGTLPEKLKVLNNLPTQLYVSFDACNRDMYNETCKPMKKDLWDKYLETLDFIKSVKGKTRTVLRMTLVRSKNYGHAEEYAELIKRAQPDYVEVKSFVFVGGARHENRRLKLEDMLKIDEIRDYTKKLAELTGYKYTDEHVPSRVTLLCRDKEALENRKIKY